MNSYYLYLLTGTDNYILSLVADGEICLRFYRVHEDAYCNYTYVLSTVAHMGYFRFHPCSVEL